MKSIAARIGMVVVALIIAVAALGGGLFYLFNAHFYFDPPKADYPMPASALQAQRQDLDYFRKALALDRSFSLVARAEAERQITALEAMPDVLPQQVLHVRLMQIFALADNGHSKLRATAGKRKILVTPVRVTRFDDGFYVMRAKTAYQDMLGGRIESIDGTPFDQVLKKLETLRGGTESFRADNATVFVENQELLYGLGVAQKPDQSEWTVRMPDGRTVSHVLKAYADSGDVMFTYGARWRSPLPLKGMGKDWIAYSPASGTTPLSLRDFDNHFFRSPIAGTCAEYIRVQDIVDTDGQKIQPFLKSTQEAMGAHKPCAVVFDLRGDGGGDYTNMWDFTHALPDLTTGPIFILTDAGTFSAAITTTAFTKDAGGKRVTIVGEPVGDRMPFYAEGGNAVLPNSKLSLSYETGKHDYTHACHDWHDCFWLNWLYPVRVKSLQPDIPVPNRFSDWSRNYDAAYERAVALASRH